jgi:serpin B
MHRFTLLPLCLLLFACEPKGNDKPKAEPSPKTEAEAPVPLPVEDAPEEPTREAAVAASAEAQATAKGMNAFSLALYKAVEKKGNTFLSPFSVGAALSLVELGARDETAAALHKLLGASGPEAHRKGLQELGKRVAGSGEPLTEHGYTTVPHVLSIGNSLWVAKDYELVSTFAELAAQFYDAGVQAIDVKKPEETAARVNAWIEDATGGKIKDMISPASISDITRLILVNAIHFKGRWREPFPEGATKPAPFFVDGKKKIEVPTMSTSSYFKSFEDKQVTLVDLPYWSVSPNVEIAMTLVVPKERAGLAAVEASLSPEVLDAWIGKLSASVRVSVHMPRWKTESTLELTEVLKSLGLESLFGPEANLRGVSEEEGLQISSVLHKTYVNVDEKGTEAAAATSMMAAGGMPQKPIDLHVDHPFLYLIRDLNTGAILFIGRVTDPS